MKQQLMFVMISLFAALTLQAGVGSVGNGGGFAEMQAYQNDRSLNSLLNHCLLPSNLCQLNADEMKAAKELSQILQIKNWDLIEINVTCEAPYLHPNQQNVLSIDSCLLYSKEVSELGPHPLPNLEIARIVFGARLKSANPKIIDSLAQSLSTKLSQAVQFNDLVYFIPESGHSRLHVWNLKIGKQMKTELTLETLKFSFDLTPIIESALECPSESLKGLEYSTFEFMQASTAAITVATVIAKSKIDWICAGQNFRAQLYLDFIFENQELKSVSPSLYQKTN